MSAMEKPRSQRTCTMCGTPFDACMSIVRKEKASCCDICHAGDTHPMAMPDWDLTCAAWGELHGAPTTPHTDESLADLVKMREKHFGKDEA